MTTTMKWICSGALSLVLLGCATGKCVNQQNHPSNTATTNTAAGTTTATAPATSVAVATTPAAATASTGGAVKPASKLDRVKVYKPDGSLQCGQGKATPLADMQKDLKNIKVHSSFNKNDGMMRIQVCGAPTGNSNVYEIDRKDLEVALKYGFKEWTFDN
ncbi:hypothetical protein [Bdellovibrio sp. HCB337]|uniref:hypothetical protein n=1 Tax=Bdellovibrio sp. HCB337 TaxID=3394358 RepID=UPI0039A5C4E2